MGTNTGQFSQKESDDFLETLERPTEHLAELLKVYEMKQDRFVGRPDQFWKSPRTFGGLTIGQGLLAAYHTVSRDKNVHSLHSYFLEGGNARSIVEYQVLRTRDGRKFSNRRVLAIQKDRVILEMQVSFQVSSDNPGDGGSDEAVQVLNHQSLPFPEALPPEECPSLTPSQAILIPGEIRPVPHSASTSTSASTSLSTSASTAVSTSASTSMSALAPNSENNSVFKSMSTRTSCSTSTSAPFNSSTSASTSASINSSTPASIKASTSASISASSTTESDSCSGAKSAFDSAYQSAFTSASTSAATSSSTSDPTVNSVPVRFTQRVWFKAPATPELGDCHAVHCAAVAMYSDHGPVQRTAWLPHRHQVPVFQDGMRTASLCHSMWFHRPFRADAWMLHCMESPSASQGRGFVIGQIFTKEGNLVVTTAQEGLLKVRQSSVKTAATSTKAVSKL